MSNLVERLRQNAAWLHRDGFSTSARNTTEAADEIERLTKENEELRKVAFGCGREAPSEDELISAGINFGHYEAGFTDAVRIIESRIARIK